MAHLKLPYVLAGVWNVEIITTGSILFTQENICHQKGTAVSHNLPCILYNVDKSDDLVSYNLILIENRKLVSRCPAFIFTSGLFVEYLVHI